MTIVIPKNDVEEEVTPVNAVECTAEESDRKWKEAFDNTTEEEFDWLEKMFMEEEEKHGTMPLDFTGK